MTFENAIPRQEVSDSTIPDPDELSSGHNKGESLEIFILFIFIISLVSLLGLTHFYTFLLLYPLILAVPDSFEELKYTISC